MAENDASIWMKEKVSFNYWVIMVMDRTYPHYFNNRKDLSEYNSLFAQVKGPD